MKKFPIIPKRIDDDYHSINDDVPLIRETDDFKEYETVFMKVVVPINQPQLVVSTQGTDRNTPRAHGSPTVSASPLEKMKRKERDAIAEATLPSLTLHKTALIAKAQENKAKVQEKLDEEEIDKMVEGSTDDESYASEFSDSILNNKGAKVDDTRSKIEPESQKENSERVSDDDETEKENEEVEDDTNVEPERTKEVVKETEVANVSGSQETRNEQTQTPISSPIRSPRKFFAKKIQEVLQHYDTIVPELTVTKTNEMLKKEMPRLVKLAVNKDREVSPVDISGMNTTLNLYPKTCSSTATTSSADLQQQLYLIMKTKPQDQAADPEI
ncbi:hypothetical protein Tco_0173840 [Tanacetum coccineum]